MKILLITHPSQLLDELAQHVGDAPQMLPVLWGLWYFALSRAEFGRAQALGEHLLRMGQRVVAVISSGAYAELVAAPAAFTFSLPETLASEAAAGLVVLKEVILLPRRWAERYYNLKRWTIMPSGRHFAPMEEPQRLGEDLRAFFRPLRQ